MAADELLAQVIILCHAQPLVAWGLALSLLQRPEHVKDSRARMNTPLVFPPKHLHFVINLLTSNKSRPTR